MELVGYIAAIPIGAEKAGEEGGGSFLVSPGLGLMIWTLVLFLFTMWVLSKLAFPKIQEALDRRAKTIAESLDTAERQRKESDEPLAQNPGPPPAPPAHPAHTIAPPPPPAQPT